MLHNFMMAACAIPPDTPPENLKMMIETARNFR